MEDGIPRCRGSGAESKEPDALPIVLRPGAVAERVCMGTSKAEKQKPNLQWCKGTGPGP